eukprot:1190663-Prorocentrum_minimum.AAC.2
MFVNPNANRPLPVTRPAVASWLGFDPPPARGGSLPGEYAKGARQGSMLGEPARGASSAAASRRLTPPGESGPLLARLTVRAGAGATIITWLTGAKRLVAPTQGFRKILSVPTCY